jgi:endonuclease/exonuclease/phosphatase family metal-dependent hydrolase
MLKKIASSLLWLFSLPVCIYTLITYLLSYTLVLDHWLAGFIMMTLPFAMFGCFLIAFTWLFIRPARAILPCLILALGYPFIKRTIVFKDPQKAENQLSVFSYNVFGFYGGDYRVNQEKADKLMAYAIDYEADIKCFQEFYNLGDNKKFRTFTPMLKENPYVVSNSERDNQGLVGLAIFSAYPIINHRGDTFGSYNANGYLMADIVRKKDTIRVINIQLQSMGIRVNRVVKDVKGKDYEEAKKESKGIVSSLKRGFEQHADEVKLIEKVIDESPYPVILCGDFNETPYGNAYGSIRDRLKNAFEETGNGFGFTLNRSPRIVRIDNQFCSEHFKVLDFQTFSEIPYSDHFPILGRYQLQRNK